MAHREDLRAADLGQLRTLFAKVAAKPVQYFNPADTFRVAEACLELLNELMSSAVEEAPKLAKWSRWGPAYYKGTDGAPYHLLVFRFHRANWKEVVGAEFVFRESHALPTWEVTVQTRQIEERFYERPLSSVCSRNGTLDRNKMLRSFLGGAKRVGVI